MSNVTKRCPRCGISKPLTEWYTNRASKNGLHPYCKACTSAYSRERRLARGWRPAVPVPDGKKRCFKCQTVKPVAAFSRNRARPDHLEVYCRECTKGVRKNGHLRHKYGISLTEYESLLTAQNGLCAACRKPETSAHTGSRGEKILEGSPHLSVDHDHQTGKVRGLLCYRCNHFVGYLERFGISGLESILSYLRQHQSD